MQICYYSNVGSGTIEFASEDDPYYNCGDRYTKIANPIYAAICYEAYYYPHSENGFKKRRENIHMYYRKESDAIQIWHRGNCILLLNDHIVVRDIISESPQIIEYANYTSFVDLLDMLVI